LTAASVVINFKQALMIGRIQIPGLLLVTCQRTVHDVGGPKVCQNWYRTEKYEKISCNYWVEV
jgi:hypothetical protein